MASGSFYKDASQYYRLLVEWSSTQDPVNNQSSVTFTIKLVGRNIQESTRSQWGTRTGNAYKVNGTSDTYDAPAVDHTGTFTQTLKTIKKTITHNSDGTKTISASFSYNLNITSDGAYRGTVTATSSSINLGTITRVSSVSVSPASQTLGNPLAINITRYVDSYTHDLTYSFQGLSGTIATGVGTSYSWTFPSSFLSKFTSATELSGTITCTTKNGDTTVGTSSATFKAKIGSGKAPVLDSITYNVVSPAGMGEPFKYMCIQGLTKMSMVIDAHGQDGATISSVSTQFDGKTYSGATWTMSGNFDNAGDLPLKITLIDSRGVSTVDSDNIITVYPYAAPSILSAEYGEKVEAFRCDSNGEASATGTYIHAELGRKISSINGENHGKIDYRTRLASSQTFNSWANLLPSSGDETEYVDDVINASLGEDAYVIQFRVTDDLGNVVYQNVSIPASTPIYHMADGGKAFAFHGWATNDADHNDKVEFHKGVIFSDAALHGALSGEFVEIESEGYYSFTAKYPSTYLITSLSGQPGAWLYGAGRMTGGNIEGILTELVSSPLISVSASNGYVSISNGGDFSNRLSIVRLF